MQWIFTAGFSVAAVSRRDVCPIPELAEVRQLAGSTGSVSCQMAWRIAGMMCRIRDLSTVKGEVSPDYAMRWRSSGIVKHQCPEHSFIK